MNTAAARASSPAPTRTALPTPLLGMALLVVTEAMMFGSLIAAYLVLRSGMPAWPPVGAPHLDVSGTAVNTVVLVLSSLAFAWAERNLQRGNRGGFLGFTALTLGLGASFLALQAREWTHLIGEGLTLSSGTYGSLFFALTGFHGLHVLVGVILLGFSFHAGRKAEVGALPEVTGLYWHFVDVVWIVLFAILYLY